ncbi:hypothetical protein ACO0RG_003015 [Hanseniaspora osmophila]
MFEEDATAEKDLLTPIRLSSILPFPITIASIEVSPNDKVKKGDKLLMFKFWIFQDVIVSADGDQIETKKERIDQVGSFESPYSGIIQNINLKVGDELINNTDVIMKIKQECLHPMVYGGLCVVCGQSVEEENEEDSMQSKQNQQQNRSSSQDSQHDFSNQLYNKENQRNGQQQLHSKEQQQFFKNNQSSYNVLDDNHQIVMSHTNTHIKVSAREARNIANNHMKSLLKQKKLILVVDLDQTVIHCGVDPTIGEWIKDPQNPNYDLLQEVKSFALEEDISSWLKSQPFFVQQQFHAPLHKTKNWYYVKTRPGLKEFFEKISEYFELHIYTMATRAYALEIAKIIDPDGSLFGDHILSRDENGSLTHKSLERLFPTDQNMVLVIDDRGDVWKWCDNLIKVVPYNFFVGIGDINSTFLPKQDTTLLPEGLHNKEVQNVSNEVHEKELSKVDEIQTDDKHSVQIETQLESRPLKEVSQHFANGVKILTDNDIELKKLGPKLVDIHHSFYEKYFENTKERVDVRDLINSMRNSVFASKEFVFSGIIPLNTDFNKVDIVQWTRSFGGNVSFDLTRTTTHLITRTPGTFKARLAQKFNSEIKVVHPDWLFECFLNWKLVSCEKYVLQVHGPAISDEEYEIFLETLELRETKELERKQAMEREQSGVVELQYLGGDESWLDNNEDELDDLLDSEEENQESESGSENEESADLQRETQEPSDQVNGKKRPLEEEVEFKGGFEATLSYKKRKSEEEKDDHGDSEDESDFEAELLQELGG